MAIIDMHAHITPDFFKESIEHHGIWRGLGPKGGQLHYPGFNLSVSERVELMNASRIDRQLLSPTASFYQYGNELATTCAIARECNDAISDLSRDDPEHFLGLGTLPMQDVPSAIAELKRIVTDLGLKGAMINDHVNGLTYDDPSFLPFFDEVERLGAILLFHQGGETCVEPRIDRYSLPNGVGNLVERTLAFSALVFGGVMDRFPNLKLILAHGGGYAAYGAGRLDKVAGAMEGAPDGTLTPPFEMPDEKLPRMAKKPSEYLSSFYYDTCVYDSRALRFLIDTVGIDRVVLGTDVPAPMQMLEPVKWIQELEEFSASEKEQMLSINAERLLNPGR